MSKPQKVGFQDVKDEVMTRIRNRVWDQGDALPTEHELAQEFGCARATVNRALRELAEQGIIDRKRKSGTRVNVAPVKQARFEIAVVRRTIEEMNAAYRYALVSRARITAPDWLRAKLSLAEAGEVLHLRCMHYADTRPFQFEERWINLAAVPHAANADFTAIGPNEWLLAEVPFSNAEIAFSAVAASEALAEFLATPPGTPLFQTERSTWFQGKAVTYVRMTFHPGYALRSAY